MRYGMVTEKGERDYSACLPDLSGCVATSKSLEEVKQRMQEAVELHLRGMREDGIPIPEPTSLIDYVEAVVCGLALWKKGDCVANYPCSDQCHGDSLPKDFS